MAKFSLSQKRYSLFAFAALIILLSIADAQSAQVTVAWDPSSSPEVTGYKVHYGSVKGSYQTHLDVGLNLTYMVANLQDGVTYYMAVTAYDSSANESSLSNEISYNSSSNCTSTISPASNSLSSAGGTGTVQITAPAACPWSAVSNSTWILITSNSGGVSNGTVNYSVAANTGTAPRTGTINMGGATFTLNQGVSCSFTISPTGKTFDSKGGTGTVALNAPTGCSWTASTSAGWISILSGQSGSGSGSVSFSIQPNPEPTAKTGAITIGGQIFTVIQSGSPLYTLSISKNGAGTGSIASTPAGNTFSAGTVVTLTATPDAGSTFGGWSGACTGTSSVCSLTMNSSLSVMAAFNLNAINPGPYTITAVADANGSISPSGSILLQYGASQKFIITPAKGYRILDVRVDGISVGAPNRYSFGNVQANHTIQAIFGLRRNGSR